MGMFGVRPAILVGVDVALGDIRETDAFMFLAMCFGFPPFGKRVKLLMDGCVGVTGFLAGFSKGYCGPWAKSNLVLPAEALMAEGELAFGITSAGEIEVVAIANGFAKGKGL